MHSFILSLHSSEIFFLIALVIVTFGSVVQTVTGQGMGVTVAPVIALIAPHHIPTAVLCLGIPVMILAATKGFREIKTNELIPAVSGRIFGSFLAAFVIAALTAIGSVAIAVALVTLLAVILSLLGWRPQLNRISLMIAGTVSGFMGTLTSIGAPPMALIYQNHRGEAVRTTLNAFFLIGIVASMIAVWSQGLFRIDSVYYALSLAPAFLMGSFIGKRILKSYPALPLRSFALVLSSFSSLIILVKFWGIA